MYRDIFTNKWILGSLGFVILFTCACYFWYHHQTAGLKEQTAEKPTTDVTKPSTSENWHQHADGSWHNDTHQTPIVANDVPIAEVSQETPIVDEQTSEEPDLSAYDNKPIDNDFFRSNYSREQLETMIKSDQRTLEQYQTVRIPRYEEFRNRYLERLQIRPNSEHVKKGLAEVEAQLNRYKFEMKNMEEMVISMSNVLNEEETNNVEK